MTRKVVSLEREIVEIKKNKVPVQNCNVEDKENMTENKISEENCPINNTSFNMISRTSALHQRRPKTKQRKLNIKKS